MGLSDVVSRSGLEPLAVAALVLFVVAFALVLLGLLLGRRESWEAAGRMPLDDETIQRPRRAAPGGDRP